jgi:hypothetical protein
LTPKKPPPAVEPEVEEGAAGVAFGAGAGSAAATRAGWASSIAEAGSSTFGADKGGAGDATTGAGAGAGAMLAVGGTDGSSRRAALPAVGGREALPGAAARRAALAAGFAASGFFARTSAGVRIDGGSAAASGGSDGKALTHRSSASGFSRPEELAALSAGADNGFGAIFALFTAGGVAAFGAVLCVCALPAFCPRPPVAGGVFAPLAADASGVEEFARGLGFFASMFGMKRFQSTPGEDPVPFSSY